MSGGHYNYAFCRVEAMADQMEEDLKEPEQLTPNKPLRKKVIAYLREVAELMRAIEWEDSGDGADWEQLAKDLLAGRFGNAR